MDRLDAYRHGNRSEWLAAMALRLKGYRIVARNFRTKAGEIDIVARRGDLVAIVEVKARRDLTAAMEAVAALRSGGSRRRRITGSRASRILRGWRCGSTSLPSCRGGGRCMWRTCFRDEIEP